MNEEDMPFNTPYRIQSVAISEWLCGSMSVLAYDL